MLNRKLAGINDRTIYTGFIFLALLCISFMFAEIINNRFWLSDFEVYYKAAQRILSSKNLYRYTEDGYYVFKYSPASAILFIPFTLFSLAVAKYIYWLFLTATIVSGFYLCIKNISPSSLIQHDKKKVNSTVIIAAFILAIHFLRELHLGQVNYLLLFIYILALHYHTNNKWFAFSILLALSIFIKPFAFIFIPYLLIKKHYREISVFAFAAIIFALLPILFYGSAEMALDQYQLWFKELQIELAHKQGLLSDANHTIFSVFARYTPLRFILTNNLISAVYQFSLLLLIGLLILYFIKTRSRYINKEQEKYFFIVDFSLLIAIIPLLAFTSENAYIYTQILIFVILLNFKKLKLHEKILSVIGFLFIGGNFEELIGKKLSDTINNISLISIGTIILICLLFILRKRGTLDIRSETTTAAGTEFLQ
jgi:hypothetical protein